MKKVFLQYRNYKKPHNVIKTLLDNPPSGYTYFVPRENKKMAKLFPIYKKIGHNPLVGKLIAQVQKYLFEGSKQFPKEEFDLIHAIDLIPKHTEKPFVVEVGHVISLFGFQKPTKNEAQVALSQLCSENCKKIIARSSAAKATLVNLAEEYGTVSDWDQILNKITVIYPSSLTNSTKRKKTKDQNLKCLFVGNNVYEKGLHELLIAVRELQSKKYKISLKVVAADFNDLSDELQNVKNVSFYKPNYTHEEVISKFYSKADVLILPTHFDIFGMAVLDALSVGVPVIVTNQYAIDEIVTDGVNGLLIDPIGDNFPFVKHKFPSRKEFSRSNYIEPNTKFSKAIRQSIETLINNQEVRKKIEKNSLAFNDTTGKKFSHSYRIDKIKRIYEEAFS